MIIAYPDQSLHLVEKPFYILASCLLKIYIYTLPKHIFSTNNV